MSPQQPPRHVTLHALPDHAYPLVIEFFALDDPQRERGPVHRLEMAEAGAVALPTLDELGGPAWLHVIYADGQTDDIWPEQRHDHTHEAVLDAARNRIAVYGWMIQGVEDVEDPTGLKDMMFTVGLTERGRPELVMYGVPRNPAVREVAQHVLNDLARRSLAEELVAGRAYPAAVADGSEVTVSPQDLEKPLTLAWQLYGKSKVRHLVIEPVAGDPA